MAAIIDEIISTQGFEVVRDYIGAILKEELENQKILQLLEEDINVYSERITPISNAENLVINVLLSSCNYSGMTQKDTQGRTIYYIDIYTNGISSEDADGGLNSSMRLHKYIGLVRYILQYSEYKTLKLPLGLIAGGSVDDFNILDPSQRQDSNSTRMARLTVSYRIQENQALIKGIPLLGNDTGVKLELTDLGYKYQFNN
jgi:hypothetical protein